MKKTLAIFLALIMILSVALVACKSKTTQSNDSGEEETDDFVAQNKNDTSDTSDDTDDGNTKPSGVWENVSYTIYAMGNGINIRSGDSTSSNKLGAADIGDSFNATATNGEWYKITYNNGEAYISADYVTTYQNEATFEECEATPLKVKEEIVNKDATNDTDKYAKVWLRTDPAITDDTATKHVLIFSDTANGELVKVGQNKAGTWYKVTYNGGTYYIGSAAFKYFEGYTGSNGGLG